MVGRLRPVVACEDGRVCATMVVNMRGLVLVVAALVSPRNRSEL
jgi:hypothetical protein